MSTATDKRKSARPSAEHLVLRSIPFEQYLALRKNPANYHLRMTDYDGILEITSPQYLHDKPSGRFRLLVSVICEELGIEYEGTGSTTINLPGDGPKKGKGKEPDQGFYSANGPRLIGKTDTVLADGDPPPDLWLEDDNRGSSQGRLPVYAAFGVPEVWQYRARSKKLQFLRLNETRSYTPIDRSLSLPMLTPAFVLEALALGDDCLEMTWTRRVRLWVREKFPRAV